MPLFGPPNIDKLFSKRDINKLKNALKYKDAPVRKSAAMALGEISDARAVDPLSAALKDKYSVVRGAAVSALGEIGDPRAVKLL